MNILIVFGREEARRRWLRNHRSLGTVKMPQGEIILENGVVIMLQVVTPDNSDKFRGMTFSAVFEDDSFIPFPGYYGIIGSRVRKGRESTLASPEVQALREALRWAAGALQASCVAGKITEADTARALIGNETKSIGQILDAADAALAQE